MGAVTNTTDPDLAPIWAAAARLRIPVFIHTGDPQEFYKPLDHTNERWLELALFPNRHIGPDGDPGFEEAIGNGFRAYDARGAGFIQTGFQGYVELALEQLECLIHGMGGAERRERCGRGRRSIAPSRLVAGRLARGSRADHEYGNDDRSKAHVSP